MSQKTKEVTVKLKVTAPFKLEENPQITIPAGVYEAIKKQIGVPAFGGQTNWTDPEYILTLSAEEERKMGVQNTGPFISTDYHVEMHVKRGEMIES